MFAFEFVSAWLNVFSSVFHVLWPLLIAWGDLVV